MVELRRFKRTPIDLAIEFTLKGATTREAGQAKDVSVGGMYVETPRPAAFGAQIVVHIRPPGHKVSFVLPAVVRWIRAGTGMGLQFGLLGARETHALTELTRAP